MSAPQVLQLRLWLVWLLILSITIVLLCVHQWTTTTTTTTTTSNKNNDNDHNHLSLIRKKGMLSIRRATTTSTIESVKESRGKDENQQYLRSHSPSSSSSPSHSSRALQQDSVRYDVDSPESRSFYTLQRQVYIFQNSDLYRKGLSTPTLIILRSPPPKTIYSNSSSDTFDSSEYEEVIASSRASATTSNVVSSGVDTAGSTGSSNTESSTSHSNTNSNSDSMNTNSNSDSMKMEKTEEEWTEEFIHRLTKRIYNLYAHNNDTTITERMNENGHSYHHHVHAASTSTSTSTSTVSLKNEVGSEKHPYLHEHSTTATEAREQHHHLQNVLLAEVKRCFGKPCGNLQFNLPINSSQLESMQSATFFPMLKHIYTLQHKLAQTYSLNKTSEHDDRDPNGNHGIGSSSSGGDGVATNTGTDADTGTGTGTGTGSTSSSTELPAKRLKIAVFNVWVSPKPIDDIHLLNQQQYCEFHGYDFYHLWISNTDYHQRYGDLPYGWLSVEFAYELLRNHTDIDYLLKVDMDCVFTRLDVRIETLIHPKEYFSFYTSQITESRFTQSHSYLMKNDDFSKELLQIWLGYRSSCANIAQEQGAFHFVLGKMFSKYYPQRIAPTHSPVLSPTISPTTIIDNDVLSPTLSPTANPTFPPTISPTVSPTSVSYINQDEIQYVTDFRCDQFCRGRRSAYHHHHCVLDWYTDNGFGLEGFFYHPKIYLFPFFDKLNRVADVVNKKQTAVLDSPDNDYNEATTHYISPMDGYTLEIVNKPLSYYTQKAVIRFPTISLMNHDHKNINDVIKHKSVRVLQPLTAHPCKKNPHISPMDAMNNLHTCF